MTKSTDIEALLKHYNGDTAALIADVKKHASKMKKKTKAKVAYGDVVVSLEDVSKRYGKGDSLIEAVKSVNLEIREKEFIALVGPSGSGKSTMLNMIAGLDRPTDGVIRVGDVDLRQLSDGKMAEYRRSTLGFVFQFFYLQPFLTMQANVEVPMMFSKLPQGERRSRALEVLESVGLADRISHLPKALSGGQMQRAAIARALVNRPKLILADEPTGNLDSKNSTTVMELFEKVRQDHDTAVLVVTHDEKVAALADRIIKMEDGMLS